MQSETRIIVSLAFIASAAFSLFFFRTLWKRVSALKWLTVSISAVLAANLPVSAILFLFDTFSVQKAILIEAVFFLLIGTARMLMMAKAKRISLSEIERGKEKQWIPVLLILAAGIISWNNFGYFGMGQDQGVYQVKAINLMYGETEKIYRFDEFDKLENDAEKDFFASAAKVRLVGLDNIDLTINENKVSSAILGGEVPDHEAPDGIFHGIPTYPALLALSGTIFGMENMAYLQTLLFMLSTAAIWLIGENLHFKTSTKILCCLIFLLSPETVWMSKSTLTEGFLSLIMAFFLFFLTDQEEKKRWWSAFSVLAFSFLHVSILAMIPLFLALYFVLYFFSGEKQYLKASAISAASFLAGYTFMVLTAPRYTLANTQNHLQRFSLTIYNGYPFLAACALTGLVLSYVFRKIKIRGGFRNWIQGKTFSWIFRGVIILFLLISAYSTYKTILQADGIKAGAALNSLYNLAWMTGLISLPLIILYLLINPRGVLHDTGEVGITLVFGYIILLMCCLMLPNIAYCYYYGRYLASYIPVVCVMAGIIWNRFSGWKIVTGALIGSLAVIPFDMTLMLQNDDTRCSYNAIQRLSEAVHSTGYTAVIIEPATVCYLPMKAMTGADCYFAESDIDRQEEKLKEKYDEIYLVTNRELDNRKLITQIVENGSMDDNASNRTLLCPFPTDFPEFRTVYYVYGSESKHFSTEELLTNGRADGETIQLSRGQFQYGPYIELSAGTYTVEYSGKGLDQLTVRATADVGQTTLPTEILEKENDRILYRLELSQDYTQVEFFSGNETEDMAVIEAIVLKKISEEVQDDPAAGG